VPVVAVLAARMMVCDDSSWRWHMAEPYMTMAEIEAKYPNEWILVDKPTKDRRTGLTSGGIVVLHSSDRDDFDRRFDKSLDGVGNCAILFTGKPNPNDIWLLNV
jgi:hypothetical protein